MVSFNESKPLYGRVRMVLRSFKVHGFVVKTPFSDLKDFTQKPTQKRVFSKDVNMETLYKLKSIETLHVSVFKMGFCGRNRCF